MAIFFWRQLINACLFDAKHQGCTQGCVIGKLHGQVGQIARSLLLLDRCRDRDLHIGRSCFILLLDDLLEFGPHIRQALLFLQELFLYVFRAEISQRFLCRLADPMSNR